MKQEMLFDVHEYVPERPKYKQDNLLAAKLRKCDEYYTMYEPLCLSLGQFEKQFRDKVVYCNCDREWSAFVRYFKEHGKRIGIAGLIYSGMERDGSGVDFRSDKAIEDLLKADIVITNPPFSLFREYFSLLMKYQKKFLVIGNLPAASYACVYPYILSGDIWCYDDPFIHCFEKDGKPFHLGNSLWFGNIKQPSIPFLKLTCRYDENVYQRYDNFDAIEVPRTKLIPYDYDGIMGVPISFIYKMNRKQFDLLDCTDYDSRLRKKIYAKTVMVSNGKQSLSTTPNKRSFIRLDKPPSWGAYYVCDSIYGKCLFTRWLIRRKENV